MTSATIDGTVVSEVNPDSPAWRSGLRPGDRVLSINGVAPRDIIEWQRLMSDPCVTMRVDRSGETMDLRIESFGESIGVSVESALFDRVQTCDNHCEFCFIYQLPKGMRRSLYLKDDDYRLSFLFGNFTTLTRFTEADLERVVEENLSPLYVSVHATDVHPRAEMLRNPRGGTSLRWLGLLLDHGITVRAQIVLCPGVNDREVLDSTLAGLLERFPTLDSVAIVPLGLSRFNTESRMRVHTPDEASAAIDQVELWQERFSRTLGRQPLHLADEFYVMAGRDFPAAHRYSDFPMLEDGIGLARSFIEDFTNGSAKGRSARDGFFVAFDAPNPTAYVPCGNPAADTGLRSASVSVKLTPRVSHEESMITILTGKYAASVIEPLVRSAGYRDVEVRAVENRYFGGNTAVAGLLTFEDLKNSIAADADDRLYVLPDVCLNGGRFLDGPSIEDLRAHGRIEVVGTSGSALRTFLDRAGKVTT